MKPVDITAGDDTVPIQSASWIIHDLSRIVQSGRAGPVGDAACVQAIKKMKQLAAENAELRRFIMEAARESA